MRLVVAAVFAAALLALAAPAFGAGDPLRGQQWGLSMIESDAAHSVTTGAGAVVAVVDSGVRTTHEDLQGRLVGGHDFVGNDDDPNDENGHGTNVAGIVSANEGNGVGVASVAPGAKVMPVRVLDADGNGDTANVAKGIDWAVAHGADVINLSLGADGTALFGADESFSSAIDRALDAGRVVVAAAGNSSAPTGCDQPSGHGRLLCVGAVDRCGQRAFYSNYGQGLGINAPGGAAQPLICPGDILSTFNGSDSDYEEEAGTSQATPHVAGAAALLVSKGYCGSAAVERLLATAQGGIVNARAAVSGLPQGSCRGAGGRGGAPPGSRPLVSVRRFQRIKTVLRSGIRVRCRAARSGRCKVAAKRRRTKVAAGSHKLRAGRTATVIARVTRRGRRLLRRALKRHRRVRLAVHVVLPGASARRKVTLLP
jgi:subtilisin family serine protease